jgi:hypothetical protein
LKKVTNYSLAKIVYYLAKLQIMYILLNTSLCRSSALKFNKLLNHPPDLAWLAKTCSIIKPEMKKQPADICPGSKRII